MEVSKQTWITLWELQLKCPSKQMCNNHPWTTMPCMLHRWTSWIKCKMLINSANTHKFSQMLMLNHSKCLIQTILIWARESITLHWIKRILPCNTYWRKWAHSHKTHKVLIVSKERDNNNSSKRRATINYLNSSVHYSNSNEKTKIHWYESMGLYNFNLCVKWMIEL